jgi:glutathione S-transferase
MTAPALTFYFAPGSSSMAPHIADIHLFRLFWRVRSMLEPEKSAFPGLFALYDRMMARTAVRRTCEIEAAIGYELPA